MGVQSDLDSFATDTPTETESVTRTVRRRRELGADGDDRRGRGYPLAANREHRTPLA